MQGNRRHGPRKNKEQKETELDISQLFLLARRFWFALSRDELTFEFEMVSRGFSFSPFIWEPLIYRTVATSRIASFSLHYSRFPFETLCGLWCILSVVPALHLQGSVYIFLFIWMSSSVLFSEPTLNDMILDSTHLFTKVTCLQTSVFVCPQYKKELFLPNLYNCQEDARQHLIKGQQIIHHRDLGKIYWGKIKGPRRNIARS